MSGVLDPQAVRAASRALAKADPTGWSLDVLAVRFNATRGEIDLVLGGASGGRSMKTRSRRVVVTPAPAPPRPMRRFLQALFGADHA